jgi:hypothetical protein
MVFGFGRVIELLRRISI